VKLINLLPVHQEAWILGLSLRALLEFCDEVIVLLHACTDGSGAIAREVANETGRVLIIEDSDPVWREMPQRQRMLEEARRRGATHISTLDCDEILTGNLLSDIRMHIGRLAPRSVLELPGYNLRHGIKHYHANGVWGQRWFSAAFADDRRLGWNGDRFHHREPMGPIIRRRFIQHGGGGIMHLWGASERRLIAKHRAYKMSEVLRWPAKSRMEIDAMYSLAIHGQPGTNAMSGGFGTPSNWMYANVPGAWWEPYRDLMSYLDLNSPPAAERECERLIAEHGADKFAGLDLFEGICEQATAVPA